MRIAIVGSGISGLSALWLLNEYSEHEVNIYEKAEYAGGHTNTVEFYREGKEKCDVDTKIVLNPSTYPNFLQFLKLLKIPLLKTAMSFSVSRDRGKFEWSGNGLRGLFCQITNLLNPRIYRMVFDIIRFNLFALDILRHRTTTADGREMTIGEYLDKEGYGQGFRDDYLLPMTAAIWSTPADQAALDFPASTLVRFFYNHHLLQILRKPKWLTIKGGSKRYVDAILGRLSPENLHLNTEIVSVSSHENGVTLVEATGARHIYDHVIMATHSDTTLAMLRRGGGATKEEEKVLGAWQWSKNEAFLHWDEALMPNRRRAFAAWNYLTSTLTVHTPSRTTQSDIGTVSLTYDMNILQHLPEKKHGLVLVTLNPPFPIDHNKILGKFIYHHPMMTQRSVSSQVDIPKIQNTRNISFVGAWTRYGFHEDGFSSAMRLVTAHPFNVRPPFPYEPAERPLSPPGLIERVVRLIVSAAESVRLYLRPAWNGVSWIVMVMLVWIEQVCVILGLRRVNVEVARLKECWGDDKKIA